MRLLLFRPYGSQSQQTSTVNETKNLKTQTAPIQEVKNELTELPPTQCLFLEDTYLFRSHASVQLCEACPTNEFNATHIVILDQTIFHPQGGGQPTDTGFISSSDQTIKFLITMVKTANNRTIHHYGRFERPDCMFSPFQTVELAVNEEHRRLCARFHSAGHLLDVAVERAGLTNLSPSKGYHFLDGPYVEYQGKISNEERDTIINTLNVHLEQIIQESIPTTIQITDKYGASQVCKGMDVSYLPDNEPIRLVSVAGRHCPCGGTHVKNSVEVGRVVVSKIKAKGKCVRISYEC